MSFDKHDSGVPSSSSVESIEKGQTGQTDVVLQKYTPEQVKKTWRKVDWYIMPIAILLYLASYIDR